MPYLFNVASLEKSFSAASCVRKFHWALAGVAGAETAQHIDGGGYATVVVVLSGRKLWAVGVRNDGVAFANDSLVLSRDDDNSDWESIQRINMSWENVILHAGDRLCVLISSLFSLSLTYN